MAIPEHAKDAAKALSLYEAEEMIASAVADERERCAKIADACAAAAQEQIDHNDEYKARTRSTDEGPNNLCRYRKYYAERIAAEIRADR